MAEEKFCCLGAWTKIFCKIQCFEQLAAKARTDGVKGAKRLAEVLGKKAPRIKPDLRTKNLHSETPFFLRILYCCSNIFAIHVLFWEQLFQKFKALCTIDNGLLANQSCNNSCSILVLLLTLTTVISFNYYYFK